MNRSPMDKELLCILCKDVVYLKESEYTEHMILVHNTNTHLNILLSINFMNNITKNSIVSKVKLTIKPHQGDQYYSCIFCTNNNQESQISLSKIFEFRTNLETCHAIFYQQDLMLAMQFIDGINNMEELSDFLQNPIIKTKSLNIFDLEKNKTLVQKEIISKLNKTKKEPTKKTKKGKIKEDFHKIVPKDEFLSTKRKKRNNFSSIKKELCLICNKFYRVKKQFQIHMKKHT